MPLPPMTAPSARLLLALAPVLAAFLPGLAAAYVRTTTAEGTPIAWQGSNCAVMRIDGNGSDDISDTSDLAAARRSLDNWRNATKHCAYFRFEVRSEQKNLQVSFDKQGENENVITWVEKGWSYGAIAVGLTQIFFIDQKGHSEDGRILDADIAFNGEHYHYATNGNALRTDVENTLTHELGHLLGLDHTCDDGSTANPKDHLGKPVPKCYSKDVTQAMMNATMYNFADLGETKKRTPEADDIAGICAIYPLKNDPQVCQPVDRSNERNDGGCSISRPFAGHPAMTWLLGFVLLVISRSRRRRQP